MPSLSLSMSSVPSAQPSPSKSVARPDNHPKGGQFTPLHCGLTQKSRWSGMPSRSVSLEKAPYEGCETKLCGFLRAVSASLEAKDVCQEKMTTFSMIATMKSSQEHNLVDLAASQPCAVRQVSGDGDNLGVSARTRSCCLKRALSAPCNASSASSRHCGRDGMQPCGEVGRDVTVDIDQEELI